MIQTSTSGIAGSDFRFRLFTANQAQTLDLYGSGDYDHQAKHAFRIGITERMRIVNTGNVLIGTTTDAGYKLFVSGSGRFSVDGGTTGLYVNSVATFVNRQTLVIGSGDGAAITQGLQISVNNATGKSYINGWNDGGTAQYDIIIGNGGSRTQFGTDSTSVASAQVAINTTTRGFLPPRMTTTQKNAIATPAAGLQIYDSTLNRPCFYDGTTWITL
jgi:hypothetical protein